MTEHSVNGPAAKLILKLHGHTNVSRTAELLGENRSVLSSVLSGKRRAGLDLAIKLADLTGEPAHVFLGPRDTRSALVDIAKAMGISASDLEVSA